MPRETAEARDVSINIVIPIDGGGSAKAAYRSGGPFGSPPCKEDAAARLAALRQVLAKLDGLLEAAQLAHRGGHLCDGADRLDWLQRWYSEIQDEVRCLERQDDGPGQR